MTIKEQIQWLEVIQDSTSNDEVRQNFECVLDTMRRILPNNPKFQTHKLQKKIELGPQIGSTGDINE